MYPAQVPNQKEIRETMIDGIPAKYFAILKTINEDANARYKWREEEKEFYNKNV